MHEQIYSEALYQAVSGGMRLDSALKRLREILEQNGHSALYLKILKNAEVLFSKDEACASLEIVLARESDEKRFKHEIAEIKKETGATHTTIRIDPTIVGGYIARAADTETDASYKRSLLQIYRALTA